MCNRQRILTKSPASQNRYAGTHRAFLEDMGYLGDMENRCVNFLKQSKLLVPESHKRKYIPVPKDNRLPTHKKNGFSLEDVARSASEMIYNRPLPTPEEKSELKSGDLVKLNFIDEEHEVERMWVEIISFENGLFQGELRNDTYDGKELNYGKKIWFHSNHIFDQNRNS